MLPNLARTLKRMVDAERKAPRRGRAAGIVAARDRFYKGDIAREMVAFLKQHDAPWELDDFSEFFAKVEEPAVTTYRGYTVYKQAFGSQGPVLLQTLNILEQFDLKSMGRNSADYLHTVVEAMKLAYADRDSYYADQAFVESPGRGPAVEGLRAPACRADRPAARVARLHRRRSAAVRLQGEDVAVLDREHRRRATTAPPAGDDDPTHGS